MRVPMRGGREGFHREALCVSGRPSGLTLIHLSYQSKEIAIQYFYGMAKVKRRKALNGKAAAP